MRWDLRPSLKNVVGSRQKKLLKLGKVLEQLEVVVMGRAEGKEEGFPGGSGGQVCLQFIAGTQKAPTRESLGDESH